jgi:hypothetical protein
MAPYEADKARLPLGQWPLVRMALQGISAIFLFVAEQRPCA